MANDNTNCSRNSGWIPGVLLIVVGTLFLLDHLEIIHGERLWRFWPAILIVMGAFKFLSEARKVGGAILTLVGVFFLLQNLGYRLFTWQNFWPVLIIGAGVAMIWGRFDPPRRQVYSATEKGENFVNAFAVFGGIEKRVHTNSFKGGQLTAMFGGVELDFRSADIEGEEATIYLDAVFGGVELVVPDRWTVIWEGQNIFGGFSDETRAPLPDVTGSAPRKRLILQGRAMFGGVSVKN